MANEKLPLEAKDTGIRTTSPPNFILAIRKTEYPTKEIGILALDPEALKVGKVEGKAIYISEGDLRKFIEKLREII